MIEKYIDHTLLATDATDGQIRELCREAAEYRFASVCVQPCRVKLAASCLKDTGVKVCTVVGFPQGANDARVKAFEAQTAAADGADEIDMVINVGALKDGDLKAVEDDIARVVKSCEGKLTKVIIECCLLTDEEKKTACLIAKRAGADYVKTSTGMSSGGATAEDVRLMRETVGHETGVKAAGGIRDLKAAQSMLGAGATRIGTSRGVEIVEEEA